MDGISAEQVTRRVREVLHRRGVSRADVARIVGLTQSTADARLYGQSRWQGHELFLLALGLGIDVDEFAPEQELAS